MGYLLGRRLHIEDMLLEESIFAVHMRAVEKSISVDDLVPKVSFIVRVVILLVLDVVLVALHVLSWRLFRNWKCLARLARLLEAKWAIVPFLLFNTGLGVLRAPFFVECLLEAAEFVIEIDKDVGAGYLNERVVTGAQENDVLLVQVLEDSVSEDLVDHFPVARDQALLVQVDEVAFDLLIGGIDRLTVRKIITNLVALDLLKRVAECLKLLQLALAQQFLDDFGEEVDVAILVVEFVLFADEGGQVRVFVALFSADDDRAEEALEL